MSNVLLIIAFLAVAALFFGMVLKTLRPKEPWSATHDISRSLTHPLVAGGAVPVALHGAAVAGDFDVTATDSLRHASTETRSEITPGPGHGYDFSSGDSPGDGGADGGGDGGSH
jgi:hypothetical protein